MSDVFVNESYVRVYSTPIKAKAKDRLIVRRREDEEPGWVWCEHPDSGLAGWVPEGFLVFEPDRRRAVLQRDYNAIELTVAAGQLLKLVETVGGWSWCVAEDGNAGWIPTGKLSES